MAHAAQVGAGSVRGVHAQSFDGTPAAARHEAWLVPLSESVVPSVLVWQCQKWDGVRCGGPPGSGRS